MTSEQWRQVEDLFHEALDRTPDDRVAFLDRVCADDWALRRQVEALLESFDDAGDFIEKPIVDDSLSSSAKAPTSIESIIGTMNLWRIAIDEQSGKPLGQPEQIGTPSNYSQHFSFSRDGRSLAYVEVNSQKNLRRVAFDPERGLVVGEPSWVTTGSRWVLDADISPDGAWIVCSSGGDEQEDRFLIKNDGYGERRPLTNDASKDRGPRWSPDGARLIYSTANAAPFMIDVEKPWKEQAPQPLIPSTEPQLRFWARSWSGDGLKVAGAFRRITENKAILAYYSFVTGQFEALTPLEGEYCLWLNDNRRLLFHHDGKIFLADSRTKKTQEVLSVFPNKINRFVISRDNRQLYGNSISMSKSPRRTFGCFP